MTWRCVRQVRPATGDGNPEYVQDPMQWLDQHTSELMTRPGAQMWPVPGWMEGQAVREHRSLWRVITVDGRTTTLTAEPCSAEGGDTRPPR